MRAVILIAALVIAGSIERLATVPVPEMTKDTVELFGIILMVCIIMDMVEFFDKMFKK